LTAAASVWAAMMKAGSRRAAAAAFDPLDSHAADDVLAVQVAAAFGVDLVLDVHPAHPGILEQLHGSRRVHRLAESGIRVH
jgi:hypothetical protein